MQLLPSSSLSSSSSSNISPAIISSAASAYSLPSYASVSSPVSQLLSSIRSVNSSALSYVPLGPTFVQTPNERVSPKLSTYSATTASIDSSSYSSSSRTGTTSSTTTTGESQRRLLITHELTNSVVYVDEGIDTLLGCEAIGGKWLSSICFAHIPPCSLPLCLYFSVPKHTFG